MSANSFSSLFNNEENKQIKTFGLQLYTLRDDILRDPKGVLKQVANAGYKFVESYEGPKGMFWGFENTGFKNYMDELGIKIISSHCDPTKDFQKKVNEAAAIGMKYLIYNWPTQHEPMDEYKKAADLFNQCGKICHEAGLRFANHNYDKSFELLDGQYPMDVLMKNTDPALVDYQMDICWVAYGKADPTTWLKKYPHRWKLCHIKDRIKGSAERDASCTLGEGEINFSKILKTASSIGMQYYIVEQERYDNTTPLKAIAADAEYMKKLRI
jgi:sugar phosphate isomerase/epimerase